MKYLLKPFHFLYLAYSISLYILMMLVSWALVLCSYLLPERPRLRFVIMILRCWGGGWMLLSGIFLRVKNRNNADLRKPAVIVMNHNSFADITVTYASLRGVFLTLAKKELFKVPFMGTVLRASCIEVDRSSMTARKKSFDEMNATLKKGFSVVLYPEGTQNRSPEVLQPFQDGAFLLAIQNQADIIPVVIHGTRRILPQGNFGKLRPGNVMAEFFPPIPTADMVPADAKALKEKVFRLMKTSLSRGQAK